MHKNVYNFFIIFQYFHAFYEAAQCKIYAFFPYTVRNKDENLNEKLTQDYVRQTLNTENGFEIRTMKNEDDGKK